MDPVLGFGEYGRELRGKVTPDRERQLTETMHAFEIIAYACGLNMQDPVTLAFLGQFAPAIMQLLSILVCRASTAIGEEGEAHQGTHAAFEIATAEVAVLVRELILKADTEIRGGSVEDLEALLAVPHVEVSE